MSRGVFKLHKEAVSQELQLVTAELMEFCLPAHFVERQVTFHFILKRSDSAELPLGFGFALHPLGLARVAFADWARKAGSLLFSAVT